MKHSSWLLGISVFCLITYNITGDPMTQAVMGIGGIVFTATAIIADLLERRL